MKMQTSELQGAALDWAVLECENGEGAAWYLDEKKGLMEEHGELSAPFNPSTDWAQGGPIIEREGLCLNYDPFSKRWNCSTKVLDSYQAETPLIAAMRCYVASKLGDEVEIPEEVK